jgi:hypothetical protein
VVADEMPSDAQSNGEKAWQLSCIIATIIDVVPVGHHNASSLNSVARRLHAIADALVQ